MKRNRLITLVVLALVALFVNAYSRTPYQNKDQKAQPPTQDKEQEAQKAIQNGALNRIAAASNKALKDYPTATQIKEISDLKMRGFLERGRKLLEAGAAAAGWNATQLSDYIDRVDQHIKEAKATQPGGTKGGSLGDCFVACSRSETQCLNNCKGAPNSECISQCQHQWFVCVNRCYGASKIARQ